MTTMYSRFRLTLTAAAFALLAANLYGCDYEASSSPQQPAAVRRPDFQGGPLAVYYTSQTTADVVLAGVTHKIGQGVAQSGLPFEYEWEDDGDINLLYQGVPYEVESPHDALDDTLDLLKGKKKHKAKPAIGMAALNKPVAPKPAAPPPLPKAAQKAAPSSAPSLSKAFIPSFPKVAAPPLPNAAQKAVPPAASLKSAKTPATTQKKKSKGGF